MKNIPVTNAVTRKDNVDDTGVTRNAVGMWNTSVSLFVVKSCNVVFINAQNLVTLLVIVHLA